MTPEERKILFLQELMINKQEKLKDDLDEAIYRICIRKHWNRQNFDDVIEKYYLYRSFMILFDEIIKILNL